MSLAKSLFAAGVAAIALGACGITPKPVAGTRHLNGAPGNHARFDDPRGSRMGCLLGLGVPVREYRAAGARPAIQVGTRPTGPTIVFEPSPSAAEGLKIEGLAQGAMMVGAALVYPNRTPDGLAQAVANCIGVGVTG